MAEIPALDDGVIGNRHVIAFVSPTTHIDWRCLPRVDSPSVFGRLLDADCGSISTISGNPRVPSRSARSGGSKALAMMGELDRAVETFNRLLSFANPLGLFSDDIDPATGQLLGNFPQAYTPVGLMHAAITSGEPLEARESRFRVWT